MKHPQQSTKHENAISSQLHSSSTEHFGLYKKTYQSKLVLVSLNKNQKASMAFRPSKHIFKTPNPPFIGTAETSQFEVQAIELSNQFGDGKCESMMLSSSLLF